MKSSQLTVILFCQVLVVSIVFYFTSSASALPVTHKQAEQVKQTPIVAAEHKSQHAVHAPAIPIAEPKTPVDSHPQPRAVAPAPAPAPKVSAPIPPIDSVKINSEKEVAPIVDKPVEKSAQPILTERKLEFKNAQTEAEAKPVAAALVQPEEQQAKSGVFLEQEKMKIKDVEAVQSDSLKKADTPVVLPEISSKSDKPLSQLAAPDAPMAAIDKAQVVVVPESAALMAPVDIKQEVQSAPSPVVFNEAPVKPVVNSPIATGTVRNKVTPSPLVMGGLGPLHLLATTLCSYQPDKLVADEHLNQLYARRASVRKSLFEFMSLKFTNLEKLSSRLGYGLQVVPIKSQLDNKSPGVTPTHGWPVVGKCTAYDLKLMGEAAWCECAEGDLGCPSKQSDASKPSTVSIALDDQPPRITSNQHAVAKVARSISGVDSFLPSPEESSVISKLLHVTDFKDAPTVESTIYNLNLTQHQLATLEAQATSTQECRRNALRYTKALFNHLAEDQHEVSESWPRLYGLISADDCARKRMIDIVNALSGFRTDTTSIRRDNLEFAFAMDDLRAKVLENEVNIPLTFDRHFIEVEQFLQQSVRLMLANIQPKRAKLTSMRYRSLMYGASPQAADDQCIDLHQRLLARSYPSDCNPTQFGQLPDVLRMTASSLELWSIEKELSLHMARVTDYPNSSAVGQQKVREDVNECLANLVST